MNSDNTKLIAFDINGTLIDRKDKPRKDIINMLKTLKEAGHTIMVWSGNSKEYVEEIIESLELTDYVDICASKTDSEHTPDIAFDDEFCYAKESTILVAFNNPRTRDNGAGNSG